jgi:hypothetical protein
MGGFNRTVAVIPGGCGINTWSFTINTSEFDFRPDLYIVYMESGNTSGDGLFTMLEKPLPPPALRAPWIVMDRIPAACLGNIITLRGTTNLPAGENVTTRIFGSWFNCTKCLPENDSVDECCGDQIPLDVPVLPGSDGINTWSREVNTSYYSFSARDYTIDVGNPSHALWNSTGFTILNISESATPWTVIDPIPDHYLGDIATFRGTTNLAPGELITIRISEPTVMCAKCRGDFADSVKGCCGSFNRTVAVREGECGNNLWSLDVNTSQHDFQEEQYWIGTYGENDSMFGSDFFNITGISDSNLTSTIPEESPLER